MIRVPWVPREAAPVLYSQCLSLQLVWELPLCTSSRCSPCSVPALAQQDGLGAECPSFTIRWMRFCCPHVDNAPCPLFSPGYGMQCVLLGRNEITKEKKTTTQPNTETVAWPCWPFGSLLQEQNIPSKLLNSTDLSNYAGNRAQLVIKAVLGQREGAAGMGLCPHIPVSPSTWEQGCSRAVMSPKCTFLFIFLQAAMWFMHT